MPVTYSVTNIPRTISVGSTFRVYLLLHLGYGEGSVGHEVSVMFTPNLLTCVGATEMGAPPFEMNLSPGVRSIDNTSGLINQFEGASLTTVVTEEDPIVVGEIVFRAAGVGTATIEPFAGAGAGVLDSVGGPYDGVRYRSSTVKITSRDGGRGGRKRR